MSRAIGVALAVLGLIAGCGGKVTAPRPEPEGTPDPTVQQPEYDYALELIRGIADLWNHLDVRYGWTLTEDFQFVTPATDTARNAYRAIPWGRELEILVIRRMFETGYGSRPPLRSIQFSVGISISNHPDPRPGKDPAVHRLILAPISIDADNGVESFHVSGYGRFYVVRGDSARIAAEFLERGIRPNPNYWWLERWEDETLEEIARPQDAPAAARRLTLSALKSLYL